MQTLMALGLAVLLTNLLTMWQQRRAWIELTSMRLAIGDLDDRVEDLEMPSVDRRRGSGILLPVCQDCGAEIDPRFPEAFCADCRMERGIVALGDARSLID